MKTFADQRSGWARFARAHPGARPVLVTAVALALASAGCGQVPERGAGDAGAQLHQATLAQQSGGPAVLGGDLRPGRPSVQRFVHDEVAFTVTVNPGRPGWNLVRVDTVRESSGHHGSSAHAGHGGASTDAVPAPEVGTGEDDLVRTRQRAGVAGRWARVWLPPGDSSLLVSHGPERRIAFPVDTGNGEAGSTATATASGADGPECTAAAVGGLLAGGADPVERCPADSLEVRDARALEGTLGVLAERGSTEVAVFADTSTRSRAALRVVRRVADRLGVRVTRPTAGRHDASTAQLVVSGWQTAARHLARTSRAQQRQAAFAGGTWLAPWLLTPGVVDSVSGAVLPLDFDVRDARPRAFSAAMARTLPQFAPDQAGYRGWLAGQGIHDRGDVLLYAAARVAYMPQQAGHSRHETTVDWFPGGTVTPVSGPLPAP